MSTVTVGDIELYYEEHGSGDPLLLIMGLAADSTAWMFQVPAFAERYRTIVFDNRGVGRSAKPAGPVHHRRHGRRRGRPARRRSAVERAHVVGVSMGGMIAQELALRHPERVRGLVLACTYPEPDEEIRLGRANSIAQLGGSVGADGVATARPRRHRSHDDLPDLAAEGVQPGLLHEPAADADAALRRRAAVGLQHRGHHGAGGGRDEPQRDRSLHHITAPTLVITGDADLLIPPANSDIIASEIPGAKLVKIPGGTHGFNFETPDIFNRTILDFLATVP